MKKREAMGQYAPHENQMEISKSRREKKGMTTGGGKGPGHLFWEGWACKGKRMSNPPRVISWGSAFMREKKKELSGGGSCE